MSGKLDGGEDEYMQLPSTSEAEGRLYISRLVRFEELVDPTCICNAGVSLVVAVWRTCTFTRHTQTKVA